MLVREAPPQLCRKVINLGGGVVQTKKDHTPRRSGSIFRINCCNIDPSEIAFSAILECWCWVLGNPTITWGLKRLPVYLGL